MGPITRAAMRLYEKQMTKDFKDNKVPYKNLSYLMDWEKLGKLAIENKQKNIEIASGMGNILENYGKLLKNNYEEKQLTRISAYEKANKNNPYRYVSPNNLSKLQEKLWKAGAFKGVKDRKGREATFKSAVDGLTGSMTKLAIRNAKSMGYEIDENSGSIRKKYNIDTSEGFNPVYSYLSNLYPYGYLDKPGKATAQGFALKIINGFLGPSDRKLHLDAIINLDLSNPKNLKEANTHRKYLDNFRTSNILDIQLSARLREDANRLYSGMPQKYNSFIINPDYTLPEAEALGVPTYTFADPELRLKYQIAGYNFNKSLEMGHNRAMDNQADVFNRFTVNKSHDDNSGSYREKWDFLDVPGKNVFIADTIPANIRGKNRKVSFSVSKDDTPQGLGEFIKNIF